ncbi:protein of unknown function (plasmid) [Shinella sp. WSC3-e]|nr:protein of unknown function [Shinella sp. WSC3-e]
MCDRRERWTHSSDYVPADSGALRLTYAACNAVMQPSGLLGEAGRDHIVCMTFVPPPTNFI